jgi:hypothetical protein
MVLGWKVPCNEKFLDVYSSLDIYRDNQIEQNEIGYNVARTEQINPLPANVENMVSS